MKVRKGVASYKIPAVGVILRAVVHELKDVGIAYVLHHVEYERIREQDERTGKPAQFALNPSGTRILLYPTPDKSYGLRILYYPPAQEI